MGVADLGSAQLSTTTIVTASPGPAAQDPCSSYTTLNDTWRATTNLDQYGSKCDRDVTWQGCNYTTLDDTWRATTNLDQSVIRCDYGVTWQGWYRMMHQGVSVRMADSCVPNHRNYTTLDHSWRASTNLDQSGIRCDRDVNWQGWYRMMHQGKSVRMADSCVPTARCGTYVPLWLSGGHPQPEDGIVTRSVCGNTGSCCDHSNSIQPEPCSSYSTLDDTWRATTNLDQYGTRCDRDVTWQGCNYTTLDDSWRASTNLDQSVIRCDYNVNWQGWYRMMHQGKSVRMADSCVPTDQCGTDYPLWLSGGQPQPEDGIVTRSVNYTTLDDTWRATTNLNQSVIRLVGNIQTCESTPPVCHDSATCVTTEEGPYCKCQTGAIPNINENKTVFCTVPILGLQVVVSLLKVLEDELPVVPQDASQEVLAARGGAMLQSTEKLVATLVETTFTQSSKTLTTNTTGAAAVALTSFTEMGSMLKADFFHTINDTQKTMMSPVLTASLPKTTNKTLTSPANFTIIHIKEADPQGQMSCVYWDGSVWLVDGCDVTHTNSTHTVCTCVHFSTFSLIMQTERPSEQDQTMELVNRILVSVGLGSLTLALLTFALCHKNTTVATPARLNLCASLLLAHLLFLLVQEFLHLIEPHKVICSVLSGVLHVLFLSSFAWMFLETIWLLRSVLRLKEFRSAQNDGPHWGYQCLIGYGAPFTVVAISAGLVPEGYGSDRTLVFKTLMQSVIIGTPWILGFFATDSKAVDIVFHVLNSQQGTFIFLLHCVLNQEVAMLC
ncbi:hypothetical protein ACEWY4_017298 [Coilia grayii]|uniref:Uncharacterized protein n=1 Tax=Coilia grayii TaxID=363190 RepID=A0ABD1JGF8_9TELE